MLLTHAGPAAVARDSSGNIQVAFFFVSDSGKFFASEGRWIAEVWNLNHFFPLLHSPSALLHSPPAAPALPPRDASALCIRPPCLASFPLSVSVRASTSGCRVFAKPALQRVAGSDSAHGLTVFQ